MPLLLLPFIKFVKFFLYFPSFLYDLFQVFGLLFFAQLKITEQIFLYFQQNRQLQSISCMVFRLIIRANYYQNNLLIQKLLFENWPNHYIKFINAINTQNWKQKIVFFIYYNDFIIKMNPYLIQERTLKEYKPDPKNNTNKKIQQKETLKYQQQHHIDSIYCGQTNKSYYRQGFGIVQTLDFSTYAGFFKNGRAEGLGLVVYQNGNIIYGNFIKDELNGISLTDDGKYLRLGVFNKLDLTGIGFQYEYQKFIWRMCKYHNGNILQVLKQQVSNIDNKLPYIVTSEHSFYFHLLNYLEGNYFYDQKDATVHRFQQNYVHPKQPNLVYFGRLQNGKEEGAGLLYHKILKVPFQIGYFNDGKLNGYGMKNIEAIKHKQIGFYKQGKKQGLFIHIDSENKSYCTYQNNEFLHSCDYSSQFILKKKQKQFNYNQKNFISNKNTINLPYYFLVFQNSQIKAYKKNQIKSIQSLSLSQRTLKKILTNSQQNTLHKDTDRNNRLNSTKNQTIFQKTSVSIIRQKLRQYSLSKLNEEDHLQGQKVFRRNDAKGNKKQLIADFDDIIAEEQNPFANLVNSSLNASNISPRKNN